MTVSEDSPCRPKKVLIITSSGGGGLLQAAKAKEQEVKVNDPSAEVLCRDVMKDWMWKSIGKFFTSQWNNAQIRGDVRTQAFFGTLGARMMDYFFWPHIFLCSLYTLFKHDVDEVVDTQVMSTTAIVKALRIFHKRRKKKIILQKIFVDLPTPRATHFFGPIKKLSSHDREFFKLVTVPPLLKEGETEAQFWRKHCNLSEKQLQHADYFLRQGFLPYTDRQEDKAKTTISLSFKNEEELALIQGSVKRGSIHSTVSDHQIDFSIGENEPVITILLGSQPSKESTFQYVKKFIELAKEASFPKTPTHLFVYCAEHRSGTNSLLKRVANYVASLPDYPSHFSVIPFSFQSDKQIAPLFHRSQITCSRSGGQTAMEVMAVVRGEIWVHSEAKNRDRPLSNDELLAGIPVWESAAAAYMQQKVGAKIVTPHTFAPYAKQVLSGG